MRTSRRNKGRAAILRTFCALCLSVLFAASTSLIFPASMWADDNAAKPFAGYTKYERYRARYDVNADGTHVETHEWVMRVLAPQGIATANEASISFSDSLQTAQILAAYTLKKDGRRIDVPSSNFQEQSNSGKDKAAPMFSDIRTKSVAF